MKLQLKIVILLSVVLGILIASFLSYQYIQIYEKQLLYQENKKNQEQILDKVLKINSAKNEQLLNDNSGWDEMVHFIAEPDTAWAKNNVDFFVNSFGLSFVIAYSKEGEIVYKYGDDACINSLSTQSQGNAIQEMAKVPFVHYYQVYKKQLVEIFGALVVPSSEADARKSPAQGYLFVGRIWDKAYLEDHAEATGYVVEFQEESTSVSGVRDKSKIYFYKDVADASGKIVGKLVFSKTDELKSSLTSLFYLSAISVLVSILTVLIFLYYFRKIITKPLRKVIRALNSKDAKKIESLKNNSDEFRALAIMIEDFFAQQEALKLNNKKLTEINATKDRLFSIIAHDLKNPVGSILSLSELLSKYLKDRDMETSEELVELLSLQTREAMTLLNSLFEWARSQTGQMGISPEHLDVAKIIDEVLSGIKSSAQLKGVVVLPPEAGNVDVYADRNMLKTVIRNLVSNAIKYSNSGDTVFVEAKKTESSAEISVVDTGIGMSEEVLEKLFKIESGLTSEGTANEKGNGLGLIICKEIVEKHGGKIKAESVPGKGSRFVVSLPNDTLNS
jgi:signal transduction histidine kinase